MLPASRPVKGTVAALLGALLSLTFALPALAEPGWQLPSSQLAPTLREPESYGPPVAAVGASGETSAVLVSWHPPGANLISIERPAGGGWQAPIDIPGGAEALAPALAMSAGGEQTVAWLDGASMGDPRTVWVADRAGGEAWRDVRQLPMYEPEGEVAQGPSVAVDAAGNAVVVWTEADPGYTSAWLVASERRAGTWSAPQRISAPTEAVLLAEHAVVASGAGSFVAAWADYSAGLGSIEAQTLSGGVWTGEQTIDTQPGVLYGASPAANGSGQAAMLWSGTADEVVHAASLQHGSWTLSNPPGTHIQVVCFEHQPSLAIDGAGNAQALWLEATGELTSETMAAGGTWLGDRRTLTTVPESAYLLDMRIGVDREGDALAGWSVLDEPSPPASRVLGAAKPAGGSWQAPVTLASGGRTWRSYVSLAEGEDGSGVASWLDEMEPGTSWEENEFMPRAALFVGAATPAAPAEASVPDAGEPAPHTAPRLGPVYLLAPKSHLWLAHGRQRLTVPIRNTNPFPVSGTVRLYEYLVPANGRGHAAALAVSASVAYRLAAHQTTSLRLRVNRRALRRLRAYVPDRGHILVNARLAIRGAGQSAASSVVLALDQRMRRHPRHKPHVPAGYPAPVNPWAQKSC
ncbi:MAG: hypothetical protein QOK19_1860 [Solirubrobacteraceae bacterium]|nr:hypothetical protein [Solirubrobacterales bacterium]MEA2216299.1 hypothetical protein [Solirubrobacteraceae bacterium]